MLFRDRDGDYWLDEYGHGQFVLLEPNDEVRLSLDEVAIQYGPLVPYAQVGPTGHSSKRTKTNNPATPE